MTNSLDVPPSSAAGSAPAAKPSTLQRIVGTFVSPDSTFREIAERPNVLVPLLIMIVMSIVGAVIVAQHVDFAATVRAELEARGGMSDQDIARAERFAGAIGKATLYFSPLLSIAVLALLAGVFLVAFRLFGGAGEFKQAFSITIYAWYPLLLKNIITMALLATRHSVPAQDLVTIVRSNPAFLVDMKAHPALFGLLASLDLFTVWTLVLLTLGFAWMSRMTKAKSAMVVFGLWLSLLTVKTGIAAAFASMRAK